jgi:hypothetical protein
VNVRAWHVPAILLLGFSAAIAGGHYMPAAGNPLPVGVSKDPTYGFSESNPIRVGQGLRPYSEIAFLDSLRGPHGELVKYERVGGGCCPFNTTNSPLGRGLLDRYAVTYSGLWAPLILYLDMYDFEPTLVPAGFSKAGAHFLPLPEPEVFQGCGCSFTPPSGVSGPEGAILFSSNHEGSARIATTDGVIPLSGGRSDGECRPARVGGKCSLKFRGERAQVTVKVKATSVCPSDDPSESCETVRLQGEMTGRFGKFETTVSVQGECGC